MNGLEAIEVLGIKKKAEEYRILVKYKKKEKLEWIDFRQNDEIKKFIFKFMLDQIDVKDDKSKFDDNSENNSEEIP